MTNYNHAVVIGGSIAGLSAAKVLASYFKHVTIIERGDQPQDSLPRKPIPQGGHLHALLKRGELALEQLFPNITQELEQNGAIRLNFTRDINWFHYNVWKTKFHGPLTCLSLTRPYLEQTLRKRIDHIANIKICYQTTAQKWQLGQQGKKITGLYVRGRDNNVDTVLPADLLIDASGAGSQTPKWLEASGFTTPKEEHNDIALAYTSRLYRLKSSENPESRKKAYLIYNNPPKTKRIAGLFPLENGCHILTVAGYSEQMPGADEHSLEYGINHLGQDDIAKEIAQAQPVSDVRHYKLQKERRYHYQKLSDMPQGLMVVGDAFCRFDPIFGQGMSVSIQAAVLLEECLKKNLGQAHNNSSLVGLNRAFHKKLARLADNPWLITQVERFRFSETTGPKPIHLPLLQWYVGQVFKLCETERVVYARFLEVMHLMRGPYSLMHPSVLWPVVKRQIHGLKRVFQKKFHQSTRPTTEIIQE